MASIDWSSRIAAYLNLGTDSLGSRGELLAAIGASVQEALEARIGRRFEAQDYTETYDGNGRRTLFLRWDPIVSVTSVEIDGDAWTDWVVREGAVTLKYGAVFPEGVGNIEVVYRAGWEVAPPALVQAGVYWAAAIFKDRDRLGISSLGAGGQTSSYAREIPAFVEKLIAPFVRWDKPC